MIVISFLVLGWVLSWFKFEQLFIKAFEELFTKHITIASYYFIFFCIGAVGDIALLFNGTYYHKI
ncbi:hypothetical protein [Priestia taiwanensis]|uniref:Uncharacterized protein n=1 Tax=Priestia taiwanensis TaxID=1347902 RepID=A0A917ESY3_9BACI|nr:hypothetical protein [Priestia taiwanensis]MBM7365239.1 hypothetical protein [Priestia taiwanensis]GGE85468.1 hypothetical protein GCM10007140_38620 [Priestia taiwanensis]